MRFNAVLVSFSFAKSKIEVAETGMAVPVLVVVASSLKELAPIRSSYAKSAETTKGPKEEGADGRPNTYMTPKNGRFAL